MKRCPFLGGGPYFDTYPCAMVKPHQRARGMGGGPMAALWGFFDKDASRNYEPRRDWEA